VCTDVEELAAMPISLKSPAKNQVKIYYRIMDDTFWMPLVLRVPLSAFKLFVENGMRHLMREICSRIPAHATTE